MNQKRGNRSSFSFLGAFVFFTLIAFTMQGAILIYDYIRQRTDNKLTIAILILIVIVILSAVFTVIDVIRRRITIDRPTKRILEATERIAEGDFSVNLPIAHPYHKYNEYDFIAENINLMAAELRKSEVLKVDFISNVSHEIKTPLAIIQNYASLLSDETLDAETRKKHIDTLIQASKRITTLISNILQLNKLENQKLREKKETFNLTEALSESILTFESIIEKKNITLSCDFDDVSIFSAKSLLDLVWNNLLSNAVKFTPEGGEISVLLKKEQRNVRISVTDTGCGISPEVGARIFDKFYQGDTSHSAEGNGLGLSLVKKVIDIIGGEISVQSDLGKGSQFTILLKDVIRETELS